MEKTPKTKFLELWRQLDFEPLWDDPKKLRNTKRRNKKAAFCNVCSKSIRNTSMRRLQSHRKSCNYKRNLPMPKMMKIEEHIDQTQNKFKTTFIDSDNMAFEQSDQSLHDEEEYDNLVEMPECSSPPNERFSKIKSIKIEKIISGPTIRLQSVTPGDVKQHTKYSNVLDKDAIDIAIAKFFYGCEIPFDKIDTSYFKDLIRQLNDNYSSPNSHDLTTTLLDKVYDEFSTQQTKNLKSNGILLIESYDDPLTKIRKIIVLLEENGQKIFLNTFDLQANYSSQDFDEIINASVKLARNKYNVYIYATVSNLEDSESFPDLWQNNCNLEYANELLQQIIDKDLCEKVYDFIKAIKLNKSFNPDEIPKMKLPTKLMWASFKEAFEWLICNWNILKQFASDVDDKALVTNDFIEDVESELKRLNPVFDMIKNLQNASIADATEMWLSLDLPEDCQNSLNIIRNNALKIYSFAANLLHPKYRGNKLTNDQKDEGEMFIFDECNAAGLEDYQAFCSNSSSVFSTLSNKGELTTTTFWGLANRRHQNLAKLATKLLRIPATLMQNHNTLIFHENQEGIIDLDTEQSKKLLFLHYAFNNLKQESTNL